MPYRRKKLTFAISSPDEFLCLISAEYEQEFGWSRADITWHVRQNRPSDARHTTSASCTTEARRKCSRHQTGNYEDGKLRPCPITIINAASRATLSDRLLLVAAESNQIKSNLFAISSVHNITIHKFALRLAGQTGDNFALMSAHNN